MSKSEEMKFQVKLAKLQVQLGGIIGIGIALTASSFGVIAGLVTTNDLREILLILQIAGVLVIGGYVILFFSILEMKKKFNAMMKEAERFGQESTSTHRVTPIDLADDKSLADKS
jgi:hypothetical protein